MLLEPLLCSDIPSNSSRMTPTLNAARLNQNAYQKKKSKERNMRKARLLLEQFPVPNQIFARKFQKFLKTFAAKASIVRL